MSINTPLTMLPKVSICLPVFNGEEYLSDAIESILSQSMENFELIIVDDCSQDNSLEIINNFIKQDKRIKFYQNKHNLGLFGNYNSCLKKTSTNLIKPFAQDDLLHPYALEKAVEILDNMPNVVLTSLKRASIDDSGQEVTGLDISNRLLENKIISGNEVIQECLFPFANLIGEPSTVLFRRLNFMPKFNERYYHLGDIDFWLNLLLHGDFYLSSSKYCFFRRHIKSASFKNLKELKTASDLIYFAENFKWIIEGCNETYESFLEQALKDFSRHLSAQINQGYISKETMCPSTPIDTNNTKDTKIDPLNDLNAFRELSFQALKLLSKYVENNVWYDEKSKIAFEKQKIIDSLESDLRSMLECFSWRITRPLRDINKIIKTYDKNNSVDEFQAQLYSADLLIQQQQYIEYLDKSITNIKMSRSWKITRSLRNNFKKLSQKI